MKISHWATTFRFQQITMPAFSPAPATATLRCATVAFHTEGRDESHFIDYDAAPRATLAGLAFSCWCHDFRFQISRCEMPLIFDERDAAFAAAGSSYSLRRRVSITQRHALLRAAYAARIAAFAAALLLSWYFSGWDFLRGRLRHFSHDTNSQRHAIAIDSH